MKTPLTLLALTLFVFLSQQRLSDACDAPQGNSDEAKCRKDTCGELVEKNHNRGSSSDSDSDSGSGDSGSDSGSDADGDGDSDSSTGDSGDNQDDWEDDDGADAHVSDLVTAVTSPSGATRKYKHNRFHCMLVDALRNISVVLVTEEQRVTFEAFIRVIEVTILRSVTLTEIEKVVQCSYAVKHFLEVNIEISQLISFESISIWGSIFDLTYVSIDLQADICEQVVTLDNNDDCLLFQALRNATFGDSEKYTITLELIEELKVILLDVSLSYAQKMAKIYLKLKVFLEVNVEWEEFFLEIEIEGFGSFESFRDVSQGYHRALTISVVISGSSDSDCPLLKGLADAYGNTSFPISVRNQIKQFHDKLLLYFSSVTDVELRLKYVSEQYWQLIIVERWIVKYMSVITLTEANGEKWGIFYDIIWVSQFCKNSGTCGCVSCGLGTTPSPVTTTSPVTTIAPAVCPNRAQLIVVSAQNTTILTDVLTEHYNTWNSTTKIGFNSYFNQIRRAIWDNVAYATVSVKITEIVRVFKSYNSNNLEKQKVVMDIFIQKWNGNIKQFCDCGSG